MHSKLKMDLLKLGASLLVVGSMATTFAGQSAFAAPPDCSNGSTPPATSPGITIPGSATTTPPTSGSCPLAFSADNTGGTLTLTTNVGTVLTNFTIDPTTHAHQGNFSFTTGVADDRSSDAGWNVAASGNPLTGPGTATANVEFDATTNASYTSTPIDGGTCPTNGDPHAAFTLDGTTLSGVFASITPTTGAVINCSSIVTTTGFVPFAGKPSGTYTGTITLTLTNVHP